MTNAATANDPSPRRFRRSTFWIGLSFLLSFILLIWSFTLPFRQSDGLVHLESNTEVETVTATEVVHHKQLQADQFFEAAKALDDELMRKVREKHQVAEKPGIEQSRQAWNHHVQSVQRQLKELGTPEKGTLEWQYQQELIGSLEDEPRE